MYYDFFQVVFGVVLVGVEVSDGWTVICLVLMNEFEFMMY